LPPNFSESQIVTISGVAFSIHFPPFDEDFNFESQLSLRDHKIKLRLLFRLATFK